MNIDQTHRYIVDRIALLEAKKEKVEFEKEKLEAETARYNLMISEYNDLLDRITEG